MENKRQELEARISELRERVSYALASGRRGEYLLDKIAEAERELAELDADDAALEGAILNDPDLPAIIKELGDLEFGQPEQMTVSRRHYQLTNTNCASCATCADKPVCFDVMRAEAGLTFVPGLCGDYKPEGEAQ